MPEAEPTSPKKISPSCAASIFFFMAGTFSLQMPMLLSLRLHQRWGKTRQDGYLKPLVHHTLNR